MAKSIILELSDEQLDVLQPMLRAMKEGEAMFAQIYGDGMRVKVFDKTTARRVQDAIGTASPTELHNSAYEAQASTTKRSH